MALPSQGHSLRRRSGVLAKLRPPPWHYPQQPSRSASKRAKNSESSMLTIALYRYVPYTTHKTHTLGRFPSALPPKRLGAHNTHNENGRFGNMTSRSVYKTHRSPFTLFLSYAFSVEKTSSEKLLERVCSLACHTVCPTQTPHF